MKNLYLTLTVIPSVDGDRLSYDGFLDLEDIEYLTQQFMICSQVKTMEGEFSFICRVNDRHVLLHLFLKPWKWSKRRDHNVKCFCAVIGQDKMKCLFRDRGMETSRTKGDPNRGLGHSSETLKFIHFSDGKICCGANHANLLIRDRDDVSGGIKGIAVDLTINTRKIFVNPFTNTPERSIVRGFEIKRMLIGVAVKRDHYWRRHSIKEITSKGQKIKKNVEKSRKIKKNSGNY